VDFLWLDHTEGKALDTPESRAGLSKTLEELTARITDRTVQHYYKEAFREKIRKAFAPQAAQKQPWQPQQKQPWSGGQYGNKYGKQPILQPVTPLRRPTFGKGELFSQALLACVINNPEIFADIEEECGQLHFSENRLDRLRQAALSTLNRGSGLDGQGLKVHLTDQGYGEELGRLLSDSLYTHASFARPNSNPAAALAAWQEAWKAMQAHGAKGELQQAIQAMKEDLSEENEKRLKALREIRNISDG